MCIVEFHLLVFFTLSFISSCTFELGFLSSMQFSWKVLVVLLEAKFIMHIERDDNVTYKKIVFVSGLDYTW